MSLREVCSLWLMDSSSGSEAQRGRREAKPLCCDHGMRNMAKRRYRVTEANIAKKLEEGLGTGTGSSFKPWLTIHDLSSHG